MTNREPQIDELFAQAVELSLDDREKFFAARAGDGMSAETLDEVTALLTNYRQADAKEFLREALVSNVAPTLQPGQNFESYRIVRLIAEGGMGEVYLAEDEELKRKVAIKLIKGHATKEILRRFQTERQILANLQHPNIAQLYEAGATSAGLPFFVMEYVEGKPIDEFIRDEELSLGERLKLFRAVCSAVSYAHQNLVIHRDIKPGNVFVTKAGEVKLLDFGIAKLLQQEDAEGEAAATATMFRALTPQYASPEQVKGNPITTASDVYSLGVLFYELLTGQRPYKLKHRTAEEITKAICEQEPTKPSSVVRDQRSEVSKSEQPAVAGGQSPQSAIRNPKLLRGDLDNIILKALRKEPSRRYASVEQLSEDIRRYLEGLPVSARKTTLGYRTSKFIKRNRLGVAAAALIVLTLGGGIIATTVEARRANRRFNEARQLAHTILFDYHDEIASLPGSTKVRERLVKDAVSYLDNLSKEAGNDVSLWRELALAYEKVAAVQGGSTGTHGPGSSSNLGDTQGALVSERKALAIRERLVARAPSDRKLRNELAYCYEGLASLHTLAGPPEKVLEYVNKAIPILEESVAAEPADEEVKYMLGITYLYKARALGNPFTANLGDTKGALEFLNKGQPIDESLAADHPTDVLYQQTLGSVYNTTALLMQANGNEKDALEFDIKAAGVDQRLVDLEPNNTLFKSELAIQIGNAGSSMVKLGDTAGALGKFKQALAIYESILAADPNDAATRRNAGVGYRNVGVAIGTNNRAEALKNFNKALEIFGGLVAKDASNGDFRRQCAFTYLALSRFQVKANDSNDAVDSAQQGIKIDEVLVAASPTNASARNTLALLYRQLGDSHAALGARGSKQQWNAARDAYQKALDIYQDMKSKGTLNGADASKPDELAKEIAKCDAALKMSD
jgi:serine/threonine protein kinase/tetratricopeptide (TPR) repeat protein